MKVLAKWTPKYLSKEPSESPEKLDLYESTGGTEVEEIRASGNFADRMTKHDFTILEKANGDTSQCREESLFIFRKNETGK